MSLKRTATSPAEKQPHKKSTMPPKKFVAATDGTKVTIEVFGINDKDYYGSLSDAELLFIWEKTFNRCQDEIFGMSQKRGLNRHFRGTFTLNTVIQHSDIWREECFVFRRRAIDAKSDDDYDSVHCRIIVKNKPAQAEIGNIVRITATTNEFSVSPDDIGKWLCKFGSVSSNYDYVKNSVGLRTDVLEVDLLLRKHIPEFLPISGSKVQIAYPGIPKACINCYKFGHMKRNCRGAKVDWIQRVAEFRKTGEFEDSLFGKWIQILDQ